MVSAPVAPDAARGRGINGIGIARAGPNGTQPGEALEQTGSHPGGIRHSTHSLRLHRALTTRKYRRLFSSKVTTKPGPKGPSQGVIAAVVDMKRRNPTWGCPRIAQQIALAFGIPINKDVVRRILAVRYRPAPDSAGLSWLTVLGHAKDSL